MKYIVLALVLGIIAIFLWGMSSSRASEACPNGSVAEITAKAAEIGLPLRFSAEKADIADTQTYVGLKFGTAPFNWADVVKVGLFMRKDGAMIIFMIDKNDCSLGALVDTDFGHTSNKPQMSLPAPPALLPHGLRLIRG